MSLRDQILAPRPARTRAVEMPEWGITVHVRALSVAECERLDARVLGPDRDAAGLIVAMVMAAACDEDGRPIFTADDAKAIGSLPADEVKRVYQAAARFNGYMTDPEGEGDAGKAPAATPGAATSSGSPSGSAA